MATTEPNLKVRPRDDPTYDVDPGRGWIIFASVLIVIAGTLNVIYGIAAISNASFYAGNIKFVAGDLKTWGWLLTIVGVAQILVSYGIVAQTEWGRWGGILFASLNMILQFLAIASHPALSVMIFFVDVIVIFGLVTYGGRDRYSLAG